MSWLIVGLGNPGREYENTRHNIGFKVLDSLPFDLVWKEKFKGVLANYSHRGEQVIFLKPQTYMNLSGESVQPCAHFFKIPSDNILVIYDELDLPFGMLQMRPGGGLAGHNGLKSLAERLATKEFKRMRMGIGRPERGSVSNHVLSEFDSNQAAVLDDFLKAGTQAIEAVLDNGFEKAANKFSKKKVVL